MAQEEEKNIFEKVVKPLFTFAGLIGAVLLAVAYFMLIRILVNGVNVEFGVQRAIIFAGINAAFTFAILVMFWIFGGALGKQTPKAIKVYEEYSNLLPKKAKKLHSGTFYTTRHLTVSGLIKIGVAFISILAVSIFFIQGMFPPIDPANYATEELYQIAEAARQEGISSIYTFVITNIITTFATGLLSIVKAYDNELEHQFPYIEKKIYDMKQDELLSSKVELVKEVQDDSL